jgi:TolA-binding protein
MKRTACAHAWQAQAIEDGRLSESDAAGFLRHAAGCADCTRELAALAGLRAALSQLPTLTSTPRERRRQRNELLRRANELTLGPSRRGLGRFALALVACGCLVLGLALWPRSDAAWPPRSEAPRGASVPGTPTFQIVTSQDATWRTLERSSTLRLLAQRGRLEIAVDKLQPGQRFVVTLPDGELEVKGTRFVIDIAATATRRVQVSEGRVALRIDGQPERMLAAGEGWEAAAVPDASAAAAPRGEPSAQGDAARAPSQSTQPELVQHGPSQRGRTQPTVTVPSTATARAAPEPAALPERAAGPSFASAMAAFTAGDYARADALFARFEQDHAADARVEDALFLRAVAHARRGDVAASRAVAQRYLERYPAGLRRPEATRMAEAP